MQRSLLPAPAVVALGVLLVWTASAAADTLDDIKRRGTLLWGADAEGGGPFVYPRDDDPTRYQGFEVELADYLAEKLGVKAQFAQGQWGRLPDLVRRRDIDIVLNGYEWKPVLAERLGTTIPYYVYELQMLVRQDDKRFQDLGDLRKQRGGKLRIAVLGGSAAETYLREELGQWVDPVIYEGTTDAMRGVELAIDGLDATLQDLPIVTFYQPRFPKLRRLGEPLAPGYYTILTRQEDKTLVQALNAAILAGFQDGKIPAILDKYGLWNDTQCRRGLLTDAEGNFQPDLPGRKSGRTGQQADVGASDLWLRYPLLVQGALITIVLAVASMPLAIVAGLGIALGRLYGPWPIRYPLGWYVEVVRGTPLLLQLLVIFFLLPELGIQFPPLIAGILGLALNYSAYEAEIYRAGLQAIPRGQMEAALSLGMSRGLALRRIIIPQAVRLVIPPVMNDFIAMFKDTAVCSVITVVELSKQYYIHAQSTGAVVQLGVATAILYLIMSYPLAILVGRIEKRFATGHGHH